MKTVLQQYLDLVDDDEKMRIIKGHEEFERTGAIGDEPIRQHANAFMKSIGLQDNVVMWMRELTFECYRYFAMKWIDDHENR
jgi:hypothetical protein